MKLTKQPELPEEPAQIQESVGDCSKTERHKDGHDRSQTVDGKSTTSKGLSRSDYGLGSGSTPTSIASAAFQIILRWFRRS